MTQIFKMIPWLGSLIAEARVQIIDGLHTGNIFGSPKIGLVIVGRNPSTSEIPVGVFRMVCIADAHRVLDCISHEIIADATSELHMVVLVVERDFDPEMVSGIAKIFRSQKILTVTFQQSSQKNLLLRPFIDALVLTDPSEKMPSLADICRCICDPLCLEGLRSLDFEQMRNFLIGHNGAGAFSAASGVNAADATRRAVGFLGQRRLQAATAVLVAISAPPNLLRLADTKSALLYLEEFRHPESPPILYSMTTDYARRDGITVTLIVNGIKNLEVPEAR